MIIDGKDGLLTNFPVNNPSGLVFLKIVGTSDVIKDAKQIFNLLDMKIEEIGKDNVVQVVTNSASNLVSCDSLKNVRKVENKIILGLLVLMVYYDTIAKAKKVTTFIYRDQWVLTLYRKHSKGRELARQTVTRYATAYVTLNCIMHQKMLFDGQGKEIQKIAMRVLSLTCREIGVHLTWCIFREETAWSNKD